MVSPENRAWIWPVALAGTIFFGSGHGIVAGPPIVGFDKFAHFSIFGLLATLVARCPTAVRRGTKGLAGAVVATSLYGALDEWHQSLVAGRSVTVSDWVADTLGAIVAVMLYARWRSYQRLLEWPARPAIEISGGSLTNRVR